MSGSLASGAMPKIDKLTAPEGSTLAKARVKSGQCVFRIDGELRSFETVFYRRHLLPVGEAFAGPAIVLQKDSTTVIPPGCSAINDPAGNLILTIAGRRPMHDFNRSNRRQQANTRVDPITGAVIQGALESIAIEMGHKLMRMSYSSIIRESEDFGAALTDAEGRQLCECKMSTPLQSGPIPGYVRGIRKRFAARGDVFRPGDVIMHNDPYGGASHGPDVAFCVPVFDGDELIGFSVTTAHHLDIGAHTPGSCGIVDAVDTYAEGLQFKAIKVIDQGRRNDAVWEIMRDNIRIPDLVVGDMNAQIAAAQIGAQRYLDLVRRYGRATVSGAYEDLMDYSERLMRGAIREIPDGVYSAETFIDGYLDDPDPARRDLKIAVTIKVTGDELTVDLDRHVAAGVRSADQPAVRGHRRLRGVADTAFDPARQRGLRQHPAEQRAHPPDHASWRRRARSPIRSFPPR